mgnify:CR=1 FL=1
MSLNKDIFGSSPEMFFALVCFIQPYIICVGVCFIGFDYIVTRDVCVSRDFVT